MRAIAAGGPPARLRRRRRWISRCGSGSTTTPASWTRATRCGPTIWYEFRRANIEIPWPIQIEYSREEQPVRTRAHVEAAAAQLAGIDLFCPAPRPRRAVRWPATRRDHLFAAGEAIVRQGAEGSSMFVVLRGAVDRRAGAVGPASGRDRRGRVLRRDVDADRRSADGHGARGDGCAGAGDRGRGHAPAWRRRIPGCSNTSAA